MLSKRYGVAVGLVLFGLIATASLMEGGETSGYPISDEKIKEIASVVGRMEFDTQQKQCSFGDVQASPQVSQFYAGLAAPQQATFKSAVAQAQVEAQEDAALEAIFEAEEAETWCPKLQAKLENALKSVVPASTSKDNRGASAPKDDEEICMRPKVPPDERISACTGLLQRRELPLRLRKAAYRNRGHGYREKGDEALAGADFQKFTDLDTEAMGGASLYVDLVIPPELGGVGRAFKNAIAGVYHGKAVDFTPFGTLYVGGIADRLLACELPADMSERTRVAAFVNSVAHGAALQGGATYLAGAEFVQTLDCSSPVAAQLASGLAKTLQENERPPQASQSKGVPPSNGEPASGLSPFLASCVPKFSGSQCVCLTRFAQGTFPNIHKMEYHRDIIVRIVQSNPIVAMEIATACGIANY